MELSSEPLKMKFPSAEKQTDLTLPEWPSKLFNKAPEILSHNFIELSLDPLKMRFPSAEKQTEFFYGIVA